MNFYTAIAADEILPCTREEFSEFASLLDAPNEEGFDPSHGFTTEFNESGGVFLYTEESGNVGEVSYEALKYLGQLIEKAGKPYLKFGFSFTSSRLIPGSRGGGSFRIYPDGSIIAEKRSWPKLKSLRTR
jgi:hypothetical protein